MKLRMQEKIFSEKLEAETQAILGYAMNRFALCKCSLINKFWKGNAVSTALSNPRNAQCTVQIFILNTQAGIIKKSCPVLPLSSSWAEAAESSVSTICTRREFVEKRMVEVRKSLPVRLGACHKKRLWASYGSTLGHSPKFSVNMTCKEAIKLQFKTLFQVRLKVLPVRRDVKM